MVRSLLVLLIAFGSPMGVAQASDAPLREDRIRFIIHEDVAGQLSAPQLGGYLDTVVDLLQGSQNTSIDIPTCTEFGTQTSAGGSPPHLFTSGTGLASNLAVIDTEAELLDVIAWAQTQASRVAVFVQDIQWCGGVAPNTIGCAPTSRCPRDGDRTRASPQRRNASPHR